MFFLLNYVINQPWPFSLVLNILCLHLAGEKRSLEAMLFLIGQLIKCHCGNSQRAGLIKLSGTQVRLR